jgi:hypothetical protein
MQVLALGAQRLPARREDRDLRARAQDRLGRARDGAEHVLDAVQQQQPRRA